MISGTMRDDQNGKLSIKDNPLWMAYCLGIFGVVAFGATLPATRMALESYTPEFITYARAFLATLLAVFALLFFRKPFFSSDWKLILLSGIFLVFTFPGFMAIAMQTVPAAHGGVVLGFLPLATAVIARLVADETPSPRFWLLSILGAIIVTTYIILKADEGFEGSNWAGYLWLTLAGLTAAVGYVIFGKLSRSTPGWEIICRALIVTFPGTLLGSVAYWDPEMLEATPKAMSALIYLGVFSMFLAFCAWNVALARGGIARMGQLQLLQVFVTIAVAAVLLGEKIDGITLVVAILVTALIALSRRV